MTDGSWPHFKAHDAASLVLRGFVVLDREAQVVVQEPLLIPREANQEAELEDAAFHCGTRTRVVRLATLDSEQVLLGEWTPLSKCQRCRNACSGLKPLGYCRSPSLCA